MKATVLLSCLFLFCIALANRAPAQLNVVRPGDPIVLVNGVNDGDTSSGPPPAAEGVEHAIDGLTQKYLNFLDLGSGFIVTPSAGPTIVNGLRFYTANDAEPRDPASYVLEGSTSGTDGPWTTISSGSLSLPPNRNPSTFPNTTPINPAVHFHQLITFPNTTAFTSYRVTFPTLKDAVAANSMQIGEVELLRPTNLAPTTPGTIVASAVTPTNATVSWGASSDPDGHPITYEIGIKPHGALSWDTFSTFSISVTYSDLTPNTVYDVRVRAGDNQNPPLYSEYREQENVIATPPANRAPTMPGNIVASAVTPTNATVSWGASSDPEGHPITYEIGIKPHGALFWDTFSTFSISVTYSDLTPNTFYDVRVRARDNQDPPLYSDYREEENVFTTTSSGNSPPTMPGNIVASTVTPRSATLSWGASSDPNGDPIAYEVEIKPDGALSWNSAVSTTSASLDYNNLMPRTVYDVRVRARDNQTPPLYSAYREQENVITTPPVRDLLSVARQGSGLLINGFASQPAQLALESSTNLVNWARHADLTADMNGAFQFVEPDMTAPSQRFYRLVSGGQFPSGLVTWWRGENDYRDSVGTNHGSAFSNAGPTFVAGQRGQALSFNGTTEAMFIGGAPIPSPWTASFWVKRQDATEASAALLTDVSSGLKMEQWNFTRQVGFTAFGVADYYTSYSVPTNVWTHLTFVSDAGATIIYANGTAVETNAATINLPLNILGARETGQDHLQGELDETTLFDRALSPAEIQQVYNETRGP